MNKTRIFALFSGLVFFSMARELDAAQIQGVSIAAVSTQNSILATSTPTLELATNVLNSTGLYGDIVGTTAGGAMWLTASNVVNNLGTPFITFNLGAVHTLDSIKVWNFNANVTNGVKTANISFSMDNVNFTTNLANYAFSNAPAVYSNIVQVIPMGGVTAQYVRIDIITNFAKLNAPVGLAKVRFVDNSVPPTVLSASENYSSNQVTVLFSEPVDPVSATNTANYSIPSGSGPATVLNAAIGEFDDRVILQTSLLTNQNYSLVASGVFDQAQVIAITNNSTVPVTAELILWLQANTGVMTDGSGNVTNWLDQSGYGHNATTNLTVNQFVNPPTLVSGAQNSLPVVNFNGTQLMTIPNDANLAINGDATICLVLDKTATATGDPISKTGGQGTAFGTPSHGFTNNLPAPFDYQLSTAQKSVWVWGNDGGGAPATATSSGALIINQYYIVSMVMHGTNSSWFLNGSFNGSTSLPQAPADGGNPIYLGVRSDSGNVSDAGAQFTGNLAEVLILRGTVTPSDFSAVNNYLGQKYNIPVVTLGITEEPASVTTQVGKTATFWVNAVGVPPITYQWKTNNVNITGATSAVYTTPPVIAANTGLNYTVTVTTPVGNTNSTAATLTVVTDTTPPTIFSATKSAASSSNIVVVFSEAVSAATALNPANYSLNGVAPLSAVAGSQSNLVVLATAPLSATTGYFLTVQNVQDLFANTIVTTNVPVLPANLSIWLRADAGVVTDTNGNVSQWLDQTANTNNATQFSGGPSTRPAPQPGVINGEPALNFNGTSDYLQATSTPSLAITGDMSIFTVVNISDYSAAREILGKTQVNQPASYDYYVQNSPLALRFFRGNGTVSAVEVASSVPSAGVPHVLGVTMQGTNVSHFLDGIANGTGVLSTNMADTGAPLRIGSRNDLFQFMSGDIAEVMIFNGALSNSDLATVDNYLGVKYFPFSFTSQPASTNTQEGVTATFTVGATQGSARFNYQWLENSTNIPGATNVSYTTPVLSTNDNGEMFTVEVIVPGISTNLSNPATLTVNNVPPFVVSAGAAIWSSSEIVVIFSEAVDPVSATVAGNYSLNNSATVLSAAIGDAPNKVVLTTSPLIMGTAYSVTVQNVEDLFNNTIVTASASVGVYPTTTALWIRADAGVTADVNGFVSEWDDQSGNANNLIEPFGQSFEPLLVTNTLNGLPVIRFNATNETVLDANSTPSLQITGDMAVFAVVNFNSLAGSTNGMIVSKTSANLPAPYDYYVRPTTVQFYRGNGTVNGLVNSTKVPSTGSPHLLDVTMQGTTVNQRLDGIANGSGALSTSIADTGQPLFIGTRADGVNRLNGDLAELVILGASPSTNDLVSLENYLAVKYGIQLGIVPSLSIQVSAGNVVLSWPTPTAVFNLQATPTLAPSAWASVTNAPVISGGTNTVTLPTTGTQMFYRLQEQ